MKNKKSKLIQVSGEVESSQRPWGFGHVATPEEFSDSDWKEYDEIFECSKRLNELSAKSESDFVYGRPLGNPES